MFLDITPTGYEQQRKMLLSHSGIVRNLFAALLLLIPVAMFVGYYFRNPSSGNDSYLKNVAMIIVDNDYSRSQGTAFLVADNQGNRTGLLLTARHVVAKTKSKTVQLLFPYITNDMEEPIQVTASIVWTTDVAFDGSNVKTLPFDVALLRIDNAESLPDDVVGFTIGKDIPAHQEVYIYGFPYAEGYENKGIISNPKEYQGEHDLMTLGFEIDHGASGAPIYNEETGEVYGIAIASATHTNLANIAVKTSHVIELLDKEGKKALLEK